MKLSSATLALFGWATTCPNLVAAKDLRIEDMIGKANKAVITSKANPTMCFENDPSAEYNFLEAYKCDGGHLQDKYFEPADHGYFLHTNDNACVEFGTHSKYEYLPMKKECSTVSNAGKFIQDSKGRLKIEITNVGHDIFPNRCLTFTTDCHEVDSVTAGDKGQCNLLKMLPCTDDLNQQLLMVSGSDKPKPTSGGDPHFTTWNGTKYDFHGECDLVLISNPHFADGLGLEVQGRTKINTCWSHIERAAIKVGDHVLEIAAGEKQVSYWLDGQEVTNMETGDAALGDYAIRFKRINDHQSQTRLDLGHGNALSIETFKKFVRVNAKVVAADKFDGSVGMLGSYPGGKLIGRDKTTSFDNTDEFGMEWQVRATDPQLFHSVGPVQHPMQCAMPDQTKKSQVRRRLGEAAISEEDAALACTHVSDHDKDACIFDVLATNDKEMAGSY